MKHHKTRIILGGNSYLFRQQGAILREVYATHPYTRYIARFIRTMSIWTTYMYCHICLYTQPENINSCERVKE
jgi:hypothetical protein